MIATILLPNAISSTGLLGHCIWWSMKNRKIKHDKRWHSYRTLKLGSTKTVLWIGEYFCHLPLTINEIWAMIAEPQRNCVLVKFIQKKGTWQDCSIYVMVLIFSYWHHLSSSSAILFFSQSWGPFYQHRLTLIQPWLSDHLPNKVWNETTYPFTNFNDCTIEVLEWISNLISHFIMDVLSYPCSD